LLARAEASLSNTACILQQRAGGGTPLPLAPSLKGRGKCIPSPLEGEG
jgi:hypothetical protein